jgi:hypothetical protein
MYEYHRVMRLIDVYGIEKVVQTRGWVNEARHETGLISLTHCSNQFGRDVCKDNHQEQPHFWALDETGTEVTS